MKPKQKSVMVTTAHRGVFFGYLKGKPGKTVTLTRARCCLYWTTDVKGFLGLASSGPSKECRIGPAVEEIELRDITSIVTVTDAAREKWEANPWSL